MRRAWMLLALLAAPLLAQEPDEQEVPEEEIVEEEIVDEPIGCPPGGRITRGERGGPAVFVRLRDGGVLEAKVGDDWKAMTLGECSEFLDGAKVQYRGDMERAGEPAVDEVSPGIMEMRLVLAIDVEPAVPWQHFQWLTTIAAEHRFNKLDCSVGAKRLLVRLPVDAAIEYIDELPPEIKAWVHLLPRKEVPGRWGDVEVTRPTEVRYLCGDGVEVAELGSVAEYVEETKRTVARIRDRIEIGRRRRVPLGLRRPQDGPDDRRGIVFTGEIKAGHKVPFGKVFEVMETFVDVGVFDVELYGTQIPDPAVRAARSLPYPAKNYGTAD